MPEGVDNVSWREFEAARTTDRRIVDEQIARLDQANIDAKERAVLALSSAEKAADKHNDLIRKMENERAEFAREDIVSLLRNEVAGLRSGLAKIVGGAIGTSVLLAVVINLVIELVAR
jgi:hypothetical protein